MNFKSVLKIDENDLIEDKEGNFFIKKEELEKMLKSQEYKLLYFLKESHYCTLHDFPALGASRDELVQSYVRGPFNSLPDDIQDNEIIDIIMPSDKIPDVFETIKLVSVGIRGGSDFGPRLYGGINHEKVKELGETVLQKLQSCSQNVEIIKRFGTSVYRVLVDNAIAEYEYSEKGFYSPTLGLTVFGKADEPIKLEEKLNLHYGLKQVFKTYSDMELGLIYCVQEGVAHGLNLPQIDLNKLTDYDNIII